MELYLIRHGIAADRGNYTNDEERPLTDKGRQKTDKVAKQLYRRGLRFDLILTSPLVRAKETAAILKDVGLSKRVKEFPSLAPDGNIHAWVNWLESEWRNNTVRSSLALVGHQPDLGNWAETLLWGKSQEKLVLKKAGVIGLHIPETKIPLSQSELFMLISPKWLLS
ncbi:MAG: phosphohistidine phosphatase SixA [Symploca sp. SIO1B1]|nr:phosphohistidine phosphatase SixA [Symploca sp. SIO1B1]